MPQNRRSAKTKEHLRSLERPRRHRGQKEKEPNPTKVERKWLPLVDGPARHGESKPLDTHELSQGKSNPVRFPTCLAQNFL